MDHHAVVHHHSCVPRTSIGTFRQLRINRATSSANFPASSSFTSLIAEADCEYMTSEKTRRLDSTSVHLSHSVDTGQQRTHSLYLLFTSHLIHPNLLFFCSFFIRSVRIGSTELYSEPLVYTLRTLTSLTPYAASANRAVNKYTHASTSCHPSLSYFRFS